MAFLWSLLLSAAAANPNVDSLFAPYDRKDAPGCALSVVRNGEVVYQRGYGIADLHHDVPITSTTVFHVASLSKQFTATAIVLLAQEGKLKLDDPVRKHLPDFPEFAHPVTIRHLIHHVSGLRDQWTLLILSGWRMGEDVIRDEDVLDLVNRQKDLNFRPGAEHLYSNTGYTLLAQIVKKLSGKSLREFTTERIFGPLGMKQSFFRDDHREIVKHLAFGFLSRASGGYVHLDPEFDTTGASSLLTSVEDMVRWDAEVRAPKVLGTAWRKQMEEPFVLADGTATNYRFALVAGTHRGRRTLEHSGSDAGYRAHYLTYPENGLSVICLCNTAANPGQLSRKVAEVYFGDKLPAPAKPAPRRLAESELGKYAGLYWNPIDEEIYRVAARNGGLAVKLGLEYQPLETFDGKRFVFEALQFTFEGEGATVREGPAAKPQKLQRMAEYSPTGAALAKFAGEYYSPELDRTYRLVLDGGRLRLHRPKLRTHEVEPTFADSFYAPFLGFLRFERDASGNPRGFRLSSGRVRHLRFDRK